MLSCKFCKNEYKSISSLNCHIKTAKFCITLQKELSVNNTNTITSAKKIKVCTFCNKDFSLKSHFDTHVKTCKSRKEYIENKSQEEKTILKNNNKILTDQTNILKNDNKHLVDQLSQITDQLSKLREDYKALVTINAQTKNKVKIDNSYNINFNEAFQKLPPFNKENILKALKENISASSIKSEDYFLSGVVKSIKDYTIVTDPSRGKAYIKNDDGNKEKTHTEKIVRNALGFYKDDGHQLCEDTRHNVPDNELYTSENIKISGNMGNIQGCLNTSDKDMINHLTIKGGNMLSKEGKLIVKNDTAVVPGTTWLFENDTISEE